MDDEKLDIQIQASGIEQTTKELNQLTAALAKVSTQVGKLSKNLTRSLSALTRFANTANGVTRKVSGSGDINKTVEQTRKLTAIVKSANPNGVTRLESTTPFIIPRIIQKELMISLAKALLRNK